MTPQEAQAILNSEFANPVAVSDGASAMLAGPAGNRLVRHGLPPPPTDGGMYQCGNEDIISDNDVEDHVVAPQTGEGVPGAKMYSGQRAMRSRPQQDVPDYGAMMNDNVPCTPRPSGRGYGGQEAMVYEDNGQKFMIANGCIYKQTWETMENGGEFRMFDYRRGKKVSPKGIVIQRFTWVPLSVFNAMEQAPVRRRKIVRQQVAESDQIPDIRETTVNDNPHIQNATSQSRVIQDEIPDIPSKEQVSVNPETVVQPVTTDNQTDNNVEKAHEVQSKHKPAPNAGRMRKQKAK